MVGVEGLPSGETSVKGVGATLQCFIHGSLNAPCPGPLLAEPLADPEQFTRGGPLRWPDVLTTEGKLGSDDEPYTIDTLTLPKETPWKTCKGANSASA